MLSAGYSLRMRNIVAIATTLLAWLTPWQDVHASALHLQRPPSASDPAWLKACSFRHPLCVHAGPAATPETILAALSDADRTWDTAVGPLALPPPDPSPVTQTYDVYLVEHAASDTVTVLDERDPLARFDRANAFTLIDARLTGCTRTQAVARGLLRAITYRVTPGIDPGSAEAQTGYFAHLIAPCASAESAARATFQAHPERAIADAWPEFDPVIGVEYARGASFFYDWMDDSFGQEPGSIVRALWALSPSITAGPATWQNEPDTFDVLRTSFKNALSSGGALDDLFLGFAAARAIPSSGDAGAGDLGFAVRADWQIDWPSKPRRLAPRDPTAPTGSAYVAIRHREVPSGARLRVEATWEEHARMRWMVVKLDRAGRELARIPVAASDRATEAQGSIVDLDGVDTLVVVGMNAGDFPAPFDPDDAVWEPHGWRLTLASE